MFNKLDQSGQSLMELVIVISVSVIIIGALVFATISSLRNAQFSKNQAQATKLAQEGLEKVRSIRDRDIDISTTISNVSKFSELYTVKLSHDICNTPSGDGPCYFYFSSSDILTQGTDVNTQAIGNFNRQIQLSDNSTTFGSQKTVTLIVRWSDFSGDHQSQLTTILRNISQ